MSRIPKSHGLSAYLPWAFGLLNDDFFLMGFTKIFSETLMAIKSSPVFTKLLALCKEVWTLSLGKSRLVCKVRIWSNWTGLTNFIKNFFPQVPHNYTQLLWPCLLFPILKSSKSYTWNEQSIRSRRFHFLLQVHYQPPFSPPTGTTINKPTGLQSTSIFQANLITTKLGI